MGNIWIAYAITFGWAIVGSTSMALGIIIALRIFDLSTPIVHGWKSVKVCNISIKVTFASIILAVGYVIGACVRP
jgi:hypothetical protein